MKKRKTRRGKTVSVIMPVRNEAPYIRTSLEAICGQDYPKNLIEVIVADGMSTDGTPNIVRDMQKRDRRIRLIENPGQIVPTALNAAIGLARGDFIVRVDGHCKVAPDYIRRCVDHLVHDHVDAVGGPIKTVGESPVARIIAAATSSTFGVGDSAFRTTSDLTGLTDTVPFPAYTRAIIERAGAFDEEMVRNQDDEYNYRLRKLGAKVLLASDVHSEYYSRSNVRSLWRQYFQYGFWKVRVMQKHPRQMRARQFVPVLFVGSLCLGVIAADFGSAGAWLLAAVAGSYVLANLAATALTARGTGWALRPLIALAFAEVHLAFGFGFLFGLFRFWNRWGSSHSNAH